MGEYVHSKQVQYTKSPASCGIMEVHHLPSDTTGSQMLFSIANQLYNKANPRPSAYVLFSDVVDPAVQSRGASLAAAILATDEAGKLVSIDKRINPKTGNVITVWILVLDHDSFREWYTQELANRVDG